LRFWLGALAAAALFAAASARFLPYAALRMDTGAMRLQGWLLTLWCTGAMAICFGVAGLLSHVTPIGVKEVAEAGSVAGAAEAHRRSKGGRGSGFHGNFAWWLVVTGALLIIFYFVAWSVT
ncbi:MAG TPA: hypothetical protein VFI96_04885, partial [Longimicrobiaceae bacterium]|nr:hypothetical protein [Longimicrobiaceae bacterium]